MILFKGLFYYKLTYLKIKSNIIEWFFKIYQKLKKIK